jgi:predicted DNA-binding transcriptional regulator YafY
MEKASRLLDLVPYLYANQGVSIEKLASDFKITRQEILSDLNTLWMCGESRFDLIELEFESGFVYIRNAQAINMVRSLSTQESLSIILGLELLKDELGDKRPELIGEIESIKATLTPGLSSVVAASAGIKASLLEAVERAINNRKNLRIDYHSIAEDKHSSRIVLPIEKVRRDGHDFLVAFCTTANAKRSFRLDRISAADVVDAAAMGCQRLLPLHCHGIYCCCCCCWRKNAAGEAAVAAAVAAALLPATAAAIATPTGMSCRSAAYHRHAGVAAQPPGWLWRV